MMRFAVGALAGGVEGCIVATSKSTVPPQNSVAVQLGPSVAVLLATDDPAARGDPSRMLQDLAEELGRMAARAMLRALDDPKTAELIFGFVLLLIFIIVFAGGHISAVSCAN